MNHEHMETVAIRIVLATLGFLTAGTAAIPAVLAYLYGWPCLMAYPVALAALVVWAKRKGGERNGE